MRFLLLLLPLALAACSDPSPVLAEREFLAAYDEARASGDAERAVDIVRVRAKAGDVGAMQHLAGVYQSGMVRTPDRPWKLGEPMRVRAWPGQARLWRARYERERDQKAREGDPDALFALAQDLIFPDPSAEAHAAVTQADRDSSHAIRQRLIAAGHATALFSEAMNHTRGDVPRRDSLLGAATAAGSFDACTWRAHFSTQGGHSAQRIAVRVDEAEACRPLLDGRDGHTLAESELHSLRQAAASGTPQAAAIVDSLRTLGVFERHPHLAQI